MTQERGDSREYHSYCPFEGKLGYNNWSKAQVEVTRMARMGKVENGFHHEIYKCRRCGLYHIGSVVNGAPERRNYNKKKKL